MPTDENRTQTFVEKTAVPQPDTFSPITVHLNATAGTVFLGIIALALLIALLQAEARQRRKS